MSFPEKSGRGLAFRAAQISGIDVWVHATLPALLVLVLVVRLILLGSLGTGTVMLDWILLSVALGLSVLLHELGHAGAARRVGGDARRIVLWPLGGLAGVDVPREPGAQLVASAGGPIASGLVLLVATGSCVALGWSLAPLSDPDGHVLPLRLFVQHLVQWNALLLILNLLPCLPMDGGRILQAVLWWRSDDPERARSFALRTSHAVAVLALISALLIFFLSAAGPSSSRAEAALRVPLLGNLLWGLPLLAVLHFIEVKTRAEGGAIQEPEEGIFGYDFSHGYTSLERTATREPRTPPAWTRLRTRIRQRSEAQRRRARDDIERRVEELLERIHREGLDSLTRSELRFLRRASRHYRDRADG